MEILTVDSITHRWIGDPKLPGNDPFRLWSVLRMGMANC